jgi:hypothetical protein
VSQNNIKKFGQHYQKNKDYLNLKKVVDLMPLGTDRSEVKRILGDPIDMGFDFRYLLDSTGPNGCKVGAVFHINNKGKIDQKWIYEICE